MIIIRKLFALLILVANSSPFETSVKLTDQFIAGIFPDFNLCQIFPPLGGKNDGKFFTGAKPNLEVHEKVRYIVLHKCRSSKENFYGPYLNQAYECEDTRFVQVLQTCHEEVAFIWSKGVYGDEFPPGFGLQLDNNFLMMMIIYENLEDSITSDNSGLIISYDDQNSLKKVQRLLLGHQASGKHVLLSNQPDWISDGHCSGHCTRDYIVDTSTSPPHPVSVLGLEVHTRSLGTVAHIDVKYNQGSSFDTPILSPTSFSPSNNIKRIVSSLNDAYQLYPGDDVILRCHHSTLTQELPVFGGVASYDELCFAVITHYCPEDQYCPHNTMTSCMSRPTDESLAQAFGFKLNYYETQHYEEAKPPSANKSLTIRFIESYNPLKTKLEPPSSRLKRQAKYPENIEERDLFLSGPTTEGSSVLTAIDNFDKKATLQQKTSANFAVLKGYHVSECSDSYGTFSAALVKQADVERKTASAEIRPVNQRYHDVYNGSSSPIIGRLFSLTLILPLIVRTLIE